MTGDDLTPEQVKDFTERADIDAPPPESEPTALIVFGTNQAMPAVIAAARYHRGLAPLIIVTGGVNRHDGVVEGREFARLLAGAEVPASAIRVEDRSADTWQNVEFSLPYLREALAMDLHLTAVSKWYHLRTVYCLRTVLPAAVPFYAIGWEPLYAGVPVTRENWPDVPDGRRRVIRESQEVPRRVADGTYQPVTKSEGAWRLSSLSRVPTHAMPRQVLDRRGIVLRGAVAVCGRCPRSKGSSFRARVLQLALAGRCQGNGAAPTQR